MIEKIKTVITIIGVVALVGLDIALQWTHYAQCAQIYGYEPTIIGFIGLTPF